ncbi:MAG TPA: pesticin C-terminus-like muramidase [Afipia sp.]
MIDLHGISQSAFDLIVNSEVSSRAIYERDYRRPERPGGASGITVGIGYDCGYASAAVIRGDWLDKIPEAMVTVLCSVAGLKGQAAQNRLASVRGKIDVPWGAALDVFSNVSIPKYLRSCHALPHFDELSPDCKGVLLSLVYNRGASFSQAGPRYLEMRNIKALMAARKFAAIPSELRKMKRLWTTPSVRGVAIRREQEARLFERGLSEGKLAA